MNGTLDHAEAQWDRRVALGVVMAADGYPDNPRKGDEITGIPKPQDDDVHVFHAGTRLEDGKIVTNGGRVLCVTALGDTVRVAQRRAYEVAEQIQFAGRQMRRDIGYRAIAAKRLRFEVHSSTHTEAQRTRRTAKQNERKSESA